MNTALRSRNQCGPPREDSTVPQTAGPERCQFLPSPSHYPAQNSPAKFGPPRSGSVPRRHPDHPCPATPGDRTPVPDYWSFRVLLSSFPLCVLSSLCGVPLRAPTIGAFPDDTAEIGRNAERERAEAHAPRTHCGGCQSFPSTLAARCAPRRLRPRHSVFIVSLRSHFAFQPNRNR